jgi:hypothetical protein
MRKRLLFTYWFRGGSALSQKLICGDIANGNVVGDWIGNVNARWLAYSSPHVCMLETLNQVHIGERMEDKVGNKETFKAIAGDQLIATGYVKDNDW